MANEPDFETEYWTLASAVYHLTEIDASKPLIGSLPPEHADTIRKAAFRHWDNVKIKR